MKYLIFIFFATSCFHSQSFKISECIQKADETIIWKVFHTDDSHTTLLGVSPANLNLKKEINPDHSWIVTKCPD